MKFDITNCCFIGTHEKEQLCFKAVRIEVFNPTFPFSVVDVGIRDNAWELSSQQTHLGKLSPLTHCE